MTSRVAQVMAPLLSGIRTGVGNNGLENGGFKGGKFQGGGFGPRNFLMQRVRFLYYINDSTLPFNDDCFISK